MSNERRKAGMRIVTRCAAVAGALSLSIFAQNQPTAPAPAPPSRATLTSTNGAPRVNPRFDRTAQDLALTEEQREKVQEANKAFSAKTTPIYSRLTAARRELDAFVNQDKIDE